MKYTKQVLRILCFFIFAVISGCIHPVIVEELPFKKEDLAFIEPGLTTRQEVYRVLGRGDVLRANGRYEIYGEPRTVAAISFYAGGGGGTGPITTHHILLIHYDNDWVVVDYNVLRGEDPCTEDGLCVKDFYDSFPIQGGWLFTSDVCLRNVIIYARPEEDEKAKLFLKPSDNCGIYLFTPAEKLYLTVGGGLRGPNNIIDETCYLYQEVAPGTIEFLVKNPVSTRFYSVGKPIEHISDKIKLDCQPGDLLFLKTDYKYVFLKNNELSIALISEEEGKQEVLKRRLIIH